jgi:hypothetical protein
VNFKTFLGKYCDCLVKSDVSHITEMSEQVVFFGFWLAYEQRGLLEEGFEI